MDDHAAVSDILADRQQGYHTYTAKHQRQVRLVMEKVPTVYSPNDITAALADEGLTAVHVVRFTKKDGQPSDNLLVGFAHGTLIPSVKKFQHLENVKISWRPYRKSPKVLQCGRCLRFNHTQQNCRHQQLCSQ